MGIVGLRFASTLRIVEHIFEQWQAAAEILCAFSGPRGRMLVCLIWILQRPSTGQPPAARWMWHSTRAVVHSFVLRGSHTPWCRLQQQSRASADEREKHGQ